LPVIPSPSEKLVLAAIIGQIWATLTGTIAPMTCCVLLKNRVGKSLDPGHEE